MPELRHNLFLCRKPSSFQQIEAGSCEEIPHVGNAGNGCRQPAGLQPEFHFVMGIYEVEPPVCEGKLLLRQFLEQLYRCPCLFDRKQFLDACLGFASRFQDALVEWGRQQVDEGQVGYYFVPAYLLMSTEGHLPSRKRHEDNAAGLEIVLQVGQESCFPFNMFDDVVAQNQVCPKQ